MHKKIDSMPDRAGQWESRQLSFNDRPDDKYTVRFRNPIEAIKSLWSNPANADHLVYAPKKIYADATKENRIFNEIWTAKWWHALQVR